MIRGKGCCGGRGDGLEEGSSSRAGEVMLYPAMPWMSVDSSCDGEGVG